jgi:hypothetical protein
MQNQATTELTFEGLVPKNQYWGYAAYYNGYQGFDFTDLTLITKKGVHYEHLENTGFASALHGDCEAYTTGIAGAASNGSFLTGYAYGWISSPNASYSFNLVSGVFASGFTNKVKVAIRTYNADGSQKAEIHLRVDKHATTVDFSHYGNDFTDITSVEILSTWNDFPYPVVFDNLRMQWNTAPMSLHAHHGMMHASLLGGPHTALYEANPPAATPHDIGDHAAHLFALPAVEHFGS